MSIQYLVGTHGNSFCMHKNNTQLQAKLTNKLKTFWDLLICASAMGNWKHNFICILI